LDIKSHLYIAHIVQDTVQANLPVKLNLAWFGYGSISPDFSLGRYRNRHFAKTAYQFIQDEINDLCSGDIDFNQGIPAQFAIRLGIVAHYVCDFFCFAHTPLFSGNMHKHLQYEHKLRAFCKENEADLRRKTRPKLELILPNASEIRLHLAKRQEEYFARPSSLENDFTQATEAASMVVMSIIAFCLESYLGYSVVTQPMSLLPQIAPAM